MQSRSNMLRLVAFTLTAFLAVSVPSYADTPYTVADGKALDSNSYKGYKTYRQWCARCHGTFGQGGPKAPNLAKSLTTLSLEEFTETVKTGNVPKARQTTKQGRMQAQGRRQVVMRNIDGIYSYLRARADGAIGTVRPNLAK